MFKQLNSSRFSAPALDFTPGAAPILEWIKVERLVVDTEYQREIGRRGAANVIQISEHFDWSKFAPVIVAPIERRTVCDRRWPAPDYCCDASGDQRGPLSGRAG